jgi:hypothetical protein
MLIWSRINVSCRAGWQVLVMDSGRVAEYGPPKELCDRHGGILSSLIDETGPSSAERLRRFAAAFAHRS